MMSLWEDAYNKARLTGDQAQRLNENGAELSRVFKKLIWELTCQNRYVSEEVRSNYQYPTEYKGPKPINQQISMIAKIFKLSPDYALEFVKKVLPTLTLPNGAEGWFAIPSINALYDKFFSEVVDSARQYCYVAEFVILREILLSRMFYNYRSSQMTAKKFRLNHRTAYALDLLTNKQKGDILIVGAQLGKRHAGRSVRRVREIMVNPEFGGYTVAVGSILLTHPERIVSNCDLLMDVPGDDFAPDAAGRFGFAPLFPFYDDGVAFNAQDTNDANVHSGSVTLFIP